MSGALNGRGHAVAPNPYARLELRSPMREQEAFVAAWETDVVPALGLTLEGDGRDECMRAYTIARWAWWRASVHALAERAKADVVDRQLTLGVVYAQVESRVPDDPAAVGRGR